jgi:hypothetical protein
MHTARISVALVGSILLASGAIWACSAGGSSSDTGASPGPTATVTGGPTGTPTGTSTTPPPAADPGDAGTGSDCGKAPTLHPPTGSSPGVYCPFSATAGGKNVTCTAGQQCCETPSSANPSTCVTTGTTCPVANSTIWQCESPQDCGGSKKCCAHAADGGAVTVQQDTCGPYLSHFSGTTCMTSCPAGDLVVCEQQNDCTSGTCTAVKPKGNDIGVCN